MADKKISELDAITGSNTAATDVFVVVDTSTGQTKKITREELNNAIEQDVLSSIDIDTINGDFSVNGNINLGDNNKAIFGAGSDLQIYHDGSHSYVLDQGTGDLKIQATNLLMEAADGTNYIHCADDGAVRLYYNGSTKLSTTATGIDVTGTVTADGLTVDGNATIQNTGNSYRTISLDANRTAAVNTLGRLNYKWDGNEVVRLQATSGSDTTNKDNGSFTIFTSDDGTLDQRLKIDSNGDVSFYEDTGTTAKMVWKSADERLGLGTTTPSAPLHIVNSSLPRIEMGYGGGSNADHRIAWDSAGLLISADQNNQSSGSSYLAMLVDGSERVRITSAGLLGIGTTSPSRELEVTGSGNVYIKVTAPTANDSAGIELANTGATWLIQNDDTSSEALTFDRAGTERMRIDSSGNVGIGTSSPSRHLHVNGGTSDAAALFESSDSKGGIILKDSTTTAAGGVGIFAQGDNATLYTNDTERLRLDASGNLLVGTTAYTGNTTNSGGGIRNDGLAFSSVNGGAAAVLNRISTDGDIALFRKDGSTVGAIGTVEGDIYVGTGDTALLFNDANNQIRPYNSTTQNSIDNAIDIGRSSTRFKDLYLGGTAYIGTSIAANTSDGSDTSRLSIGGGGDANSTGRGSLVQYHGNEHASVAGAMRHFMGNVSGSYISWHLGSGSEAMRIDDSASVLVGTTADGGVNGLTLKKYSTGVSQISNVSFGGGFAQHTFRYNGTTVGSILTYTNATAYNTSSDYRLKEDFQSMTGVTERVKALNPVNFAWKFDGSRVDGFIAHEAQAVVPEAVTGEKDAVDEDGNPDYQGIDQSKLVPLLTAALQEAIIKIEDLEARVATLEGN